MDEQQEDLNEAVQDAAVETEASPAIEEVENNAVTQPDGQESSSDADSADCAAAVTVADMPQAESLSRIVARLDEIDQLIAQRLQYDDVKEKVIDRQHAELSALREGLQRDLMRPLLYDIAQTLDDMRKAKAAYAEQDAQQVVDAIDDIEEMLVYLLEKNDVEQVTSAEGDPFTSKQRMLKTVPTQDVDKGKTIAASVAPGYMWGEEPLFKEKVQVYKFVPPEPTDPLSVSDTAAEADVPAVSASGTENSEDAPSQPSEAQSAAPSADL